MRSRLLFFCLLLPQFVWAAISQTVVFNEVAWMGSQESANDEWLELYNTGPTAIDLTGWRINSDDGSPLINLEGTIIGFGFYLLERTDDSTVPGIPAQKIYTGALENNGETLKLFDANNNLVDEVRAEAGWPAGDNSGKKTMARSTGKNSWQNSNVAGGTPGRENANIPITPPREITAAAIKNNFIIFSEILPSPLGPDETDEWIELFNPNDFPVSVDGWSINDDSGAVHEAAVVGPGAVGGVGVERVMREQAGCHLGGTDAGGQQADGDRKQKDGDKSGHGGITPVGAAGCACPRRHTNRLDPPVHMITYRPD